MKLNSPPVSRDLCVLFGNISVFNSFLFIYCRSHAFFKFLIYNLYSINFPSTTVSPNNYISFQIHTNKQINIQTTKVPKMESAFLEEIHFTLKKKSYVILFILYLLMLPLRILILPYLLIKCFFSPKYFILRNTFYSFAGRETIFPAL